MVRAEFVYRRGAAVGFNISGHAGSERAGRNVPCAAVSSAVQMAANTITDVIGARAEVKVLPNRIILHLRQGMTAEQKSSCRAVLEGLKMQLELLQEQFPETVSVSRKLP